MKMRPVWAIVLLAVVCGAVWGVYEYLVVAARDTKAPQIEFAAETVELSVYDDQSVLLEGVAAKDDRDGDVTASLLVEGISSIREDHSVTVTYAAFDQAGNVTKAARTAVYTDYEAARFSLTAPLMFRSGILVDPFDYITATDPLDGDLSSRVKVVMVSGESNIADVGVYDVELRVTNNMGDTAKLVVPLEIYPNGAYNASVKLKEYLVYIEKGADFSAEDYLENVICSGYIHEAGSLPEGMDVKVDSDVRTGTPGTYTVDYTVTYGGYIGRTRLIVVVEG